MTYTEEYAEFIKNMESGIPVTPADVGKLTAKLAQYFSDAVAETTITEQAYNQKVVEFEKQLDENGKPLTSAKADHYSKATDEYLKYNSAKGKVLGIEQMINALKSLQKGLMNEFSHFGDT